MKLIKKIDKWLTKPHNYKENLSFKVFVSFGMGILIFLILYLIEPFGLYKINNKFSYFAGYGVIITLIILIFYFVVNPLFPDFFCEKNWTIKREITTISTILIIISFCLYKYHNWVMINNDYKLSYLFFLKNTLILSVFPTILLLYASETFVEKDYNFIADKVAFKNVKKLFKDNKIKILDSYGHKYVEFYIKNLIYISSKGNYLIFHLLNSNELIIEKKIRIQLKVVEDYLKDYDEIIRCHKSYLVNAKYVKNVVGNSKKSNIILEYNLDKIPVSRSFDKKKLTKYLT